jgi:hypothetical protein
MDIEKRLKGFVKLGDFLRSISDKSDEITLKNKKDELEHLINTIHQNNGWFSPPNVRTAILSLGEMLKESKLHKWLSRYKLTDRDPKRVGVIMAGNIPLVGFHDMLCVLMSGNIFVGKLSSEDKLLLPKVVDILISLEPGFKERIIFSERIENIDAVIATGSDNTARYFEHYFGKYPNIIRKNRNSVAVLTGNESEEDLKGLAKDVFLYFGLGCRNVSKLFLPEGYDLDKIFGAFFSYKDIVNHNKYGNNYDYNKTIYLLNGEKILENGFLIMKEDKGISSPVAVLFYEYYKDLKEIEKRLETDAEKIQCIVGNSEPANVGFGKAQSPELWDYADNVDTMKFLLGV